MKRPRRTLEEELPQDLPIVQVRQAYGEGRVLSAKNALAAGMVDRIGTLEDVIDERRAGAVINPSRVTRWFQEAKDEGIDLQAK